MTTFVYAVRDADPVDYVSVFSSLEKAKAEVTSDLGELEWEPIITDMRDVLLWRAAYALHDGTLVHVTITRYLLDCPADGLLEVVP